ncbi:amino acid ABC transporter substrate-binding protein [Piscinibacter sp. XHJ-5]|uniref:amino acid ABC transporter substrate-binding protein n=1 Tax=Piscinibacter sp. XHJ-5 TaxID=3037797 RepID=UPI002452A144|nr:amino acid ABC transporter substrate-binding protein [Piscinibacter sp. XHJ-5]
MSDWIRAGGARSCASHPRLWALVMCIAMTAAAVAQQRNPNEVPPFSGTLQKIFERGVIRVGHRENSPPFAFLDARRRPVGYSLDVCEVVVEEIARHLHKSIQAEYVPVTPANRFELVDNGTVDLECGSTTASAERRSRFGFSPTLFVTGTKLLVRRGSGIRSLRDLEGKTVVLTTGTIQAEAIPKIAERQKLAIRFEFAADHDQSFQALAAGRADAFANDDVQLHGTIAARDAAADYRVVGDFLTYADYALMYRRGDAEFDEVVRQAFDGMAASGEIRAIYRKWFQRPLPSGASLDLPMSPHLEHVFRLQGLAAD